MNFIKALTVNGFQHIVDGVVMNGDSNQYISLLNSSVGDTYASSLYGFIDVSGNVYYTHEQESYASFPEFSGFLCDFVYNVSQTKLIFSRDISQIQDIINLTNNLSICFSNNLKITLFNGESLSIDQLDDYFNNQDYTMASVESKKRLIKRNR